MLVHADLLGVAPGEQGGPGGVQTGEATMNS